MAAIVFQGQRSQPDLPVIPQFWCNPTAARCVCVSVYGADVYGSVAVEARMDEPDDIEGFEGFDEFVASEFTAILALALALLHDRDDAFDVAQETMARAFERWGEVSALDRPGAWARRVALNLTTDVHRRRTRRRRLQLRLRAQPARANSISPDPWDRDFWSAIAALPGPQRDVMVLHYAEDLPVTEIGRILDLPDGTVKSHLSRARDTLRRAMDRSAT
jgi:RNA polymerase sigma-70 factor (ECF subfamily)